MKLPSDVTVDGTSYREAPTKHHEMHSLTTLLRITEKRLQGPSPSFDRAHMLLAFLTIGDSGTIGRQALASSSGLGDGSVRTVLKKLKEGGYAQVNASGSSLTQRGKSAYSLLRVKLSPIISLEGSKLTVGSRQAAVAIRGGARGLGSGIQQRDSAIMVGATGATTYAIRDAKFTIPGGAKDCEKEFPGAVWRSLREKVSPREGDAVVLCGAPDELRAKLGALSAALTLL
jgi:hypothetical protein